MQQEPFSLQKTTYQETRGILSHIKRLPLVTHKNHSWNIWVINIYNSLITSNIKSIIQYNIYRDPT